jgi:flagellar motor switch/type III secretory pathway protein FliN
MSAASLPIAEPLLLIGATRREALRVALERCIQSWWLRWARTGAAIGVSIAEDGAEANGRGVSNLTTTLVAASAEYGEILHLRGAPEIIGALLGPAISGSSGVFSSADVARGVAHELYLQILRSLCDDLLELVHAHDVEIRQQTAATVGARRRLTAKVVCGGSSAGIDIELSARFIALAVPAKAHAPAHELARKRSAISAESVHIEGVLGEVEISLDDLTRLSESDVVVLDQSLSSTGYLAMADGRRVVDVALGSSGTQRAISVVK